MTLCTRCHKYEAEWFGLCKDNLCQMCFEDGAFLRTPVLRWRDFMFELKPNHDIVMEIKISRWNISVYTDHGISPNCSLGTIWHERFDIGNAWVEIFFFKYWYKIALLFYNNSKAVVERMAGR